MERSRFFFGIKDRQCKDVAQFGKCDVFARFWVQNSEYPMTLVEFNLQHELLNGGGWFLFPDSFQVTYLFFEKGSKLKMQAHIFLQSNTDASNLYLYQYFFCKKHTLTI